MGTPIEFAVSNSMLTGFAVASCETNFLASAELDQISGVTGRMKGVQIGDAVLPGGFSLDDSFVKSWGLGRTFGTSLMVVTFFSNR